MSVRYDSAVIQRAAARLYREALSVAVVQTVVGLALGIGAGIALLTVRPLHPWPIFGGILGGALGLTNGLAAGERLRLQAQTALCQVAIEENTRTLKGK